MALRIIRICTNQINRDKRLYELKELLLERNYKIETIEKAINKAKVILRKVAIQRKKLKDKIRQGPIFAVKYDPCLPSITNIQAKHWRSMISSDTYLKEMFPSPPMTAFKRQGNLKQIFNKDKGPKYPKIISPKKTQRHEDMWE